MFDKLFLHMPPGVPNLSWTAHRVKLIHYEYFITEADAKARERFLKSGFGRKQLRQAIKRTLEELKNEIL